MRRAPLVALLALLAVAALAAIVVARAVDVDERGARVETLHIDSRAVGRTVPVTVVVPAAVEHVRHPPLVVFLHGRGGDDRCELDDAFFSALAAAGRRAPIVAFPDGGDHSYWHDRADGRPGAYRGSRLWLDAGDEDPFRPGVPITTHTWPGGHDDSYWNAHWRSYLRFYARALVTC